MKQDGLDQTIDLLEKEKTRCGCKKIFVYRTLTYLNILLDLFIVTVSALNSFHNKDWFINKYGKYTYQFLNEASG